LVGVEITFCKKAAHKRPTAIRGERGLSGADILQTRWGGRFFLRTSTLFGAKKFGFYFKFMVSARTRGGGVESVHTFCGQVGGGQFFVILCGRILWTAP